MSLLGMEPTFLQLVVTEMPEYDTTLTHDRYHLWGCCIATQSS